MIPKELILVTEWEQLVCPRCKDKSNFWVKLGTVIEYLFCAVCLQRASPITPSLPTDVAGRPRQSRSHSASSRAGR